MTVGEQWELEKRRRKAEKRRDKRVPGRMRSRTD